MKAVSIYVQSAADSVGAAFEIYLSRCTGRTRVLFDYSLWTVSRASASRWLLEEKGKEGEIAEIRGSVTNYLNDRSRTSDLRLISEALFDDRTRAESG